MTIYIWLISRSAISASNGFLGNLKSLLLFQLRHDTNFCDIELYTCEGLQKDSPILAHRQVYNLYFDKFETLQEYACLLTGKCKTCTLISSIYQFKIAIEMLQEYACCGHPLFSCNVHLWSYWERVWTNKVSWISINVCCAESGKYLAKIGKSGTSQQLAG